MNVVRSIGARHLRDEIPILTSSNRSVRRPFANLFGDGERFVDWHTFAIDEDALKFVE
jgi:hypothetical protein